jgi:hypothetical protein
MIRQVARLKKNIPPLFLFLLGEGNNKDAGGGGI